jgi:hypothetical protein
MVIVLVSFAWEANRLRDRDERSAYVAVVRGVRWWMAPAAIVLLSAMTPLCLWLNRIPGFNLSWWYAVGGQGSVVFGRTHGSALAIAAAAALPVCFAGLVPRLAYLEEDLFRAGSEHHRCPRVLGTSILFGLMHTVVGVPLSAALGLSVAGLAYHGVYRAAFARAQAATSLGRPSGRNAQSAGEVAGGQHGPGDESPEVDLGVQHVCRYQATVKAAALHATVNWTVLVLVTAGALTQAFLTRR